MPDHLGADMRKQKKDIDAEDDKPFQALDEGDIAVLKRYGQGPYAEQLKQLETDIEECVKRVRSLFCESPLDVRTVELVTILSHASLLLLMGGGVHSMTVCSATAGSVGY
ncbi:hypothetical protein COOONC_20409 [Cooperia oncophora]